jgi:hypothetical protein
MDAAPEVGPRAETCRANVNNVIMKCFTLEGKNIWSIKFETFIVLTFAMPLIKPKCK